MAGLFHPLLCSFCGFTALFPKGTVLLQLLFACLFQGVTLFCVFPVVDRQCLVLARQCRKKKTLQWEGKCLVQELFVALSFSFAFAFALACSFSKTFDGSFLGALVGAFLGSFLGALGVNFPLPLFLPGMWSGGRSESLPLPLPL